MSFYDLTKDFVLSAKDLFKYRGKRNRTIPSRGGQKDFEPDDSWLQNKALEKFREERSSVLSEARVEKLRNLVEGTWDGSKRLVNVKKTGKFWAHMGFTDKRRNWLYPEEALFLMECNALEVYHFGVPLSIQEAYNMFLGSDVSIDEYQVFSHLRRLGFVVLRHENEPVITPYEKQINLDKYINKKTRKERVVKAGKRGKKGEQQNENENAAEIPKLVTEDPTKTVVTISDSKDKVNSVSHSDLIVDTSENISPESCLKPSYMETGETSTENSCLLTDGKKSTEQSNNSSQDLSSENNSGTNQKKRPFSPDKDSSLDAKRSCTDATCVNSNSEVNTESAADAEALLDPESTDRLCRGVFDNSWESCFINKTSTPASAESHCISIKRSDKDSQDKSNGSDASVKLLPLPNIANTDMVVLEPPGVQLLPEDVCVENEELQQYDVERYHTMNPPREVSKQVQRDEEEEKRLQGLEFSFPEWINKKPKLPVANWKEYKEKLAERMKELSQTSPVDHLWKGKVTPLVHPGENWTYQSILDKLNIIQSADNAGLLTDSDCMVDVKVTFDVHLPDSRFKKSMPGVPNHRVSVCKCSSDLPGLAEHHQAWSRFKDEVPLHWAVVDSGEIAFYVFDGSHSCKPFV
ncbi:unnamed protein product [Candidula unifasciata]|uniref:tRNA-splicing endonuclease subunit Sen54 N-terminal domain-containing protein n=1 Tax=Candidula unifasciata TaxID=100452 RepID=A0A8S3YSB0_9EUPU|nr:unnamed protein product [Candidula unifasciata]